MVIGKFGSKIFEVSPSKINVPKSLSISGELNTETEDASGKKPATTIKGPGLIKISAELRLLAAAGLDVQAELDAWTALRDAAKAYPFILCGKAVSLNSFLLTSCEESDDVIVPIAGSPTKVAATVKLDWEEYLPPGKQKSGTTSSTSNSSAAGLVSVSTPAAYQTPTSAEKASVKRNNFGMNGGRYAQ